MKSNEIMTGIYEMMNILKKNTIGGKSILRKPFLEKVKSGECWMVGGNWIIFFGVQTKCSV
jgi:hypothetical protein